MMMQLGERRDAAGGDNAAGRRSDHHDSRCHRFCRFPSPMSVRYIYTLLFLLANVFAWVIRESHVTFFERQRRSGCHGNHDCLAADGVLVISHTSFLFFLVMFFSTVNTTKLQDPRNSWHCQWWLAKILLLGASIMISTFAPTYWMQLYGKIAPFGAGIFLFIQLISVMRLITKLNHKWCQTNFETRYLVVIAVSVIAYSGSMVAIILMSLWYTGCGLNMAFIGTTMILVLLLPLISIKSKANGFYMEPGMVGAYSVFLCFAAITSEPETECYKKEKAGAWAHFKTIVVDRYLAGWKAILLNHAGRVVLLNSVLDGLPTYLMGAVPLPLGILAQLDAKRRAFLWSGTSTVSGAKCLVAWEKACLSKKDGGLGVRRLDVQNSCLLLKLIHRLYHHDGSAWANWARDRICLATLDGDVQGDHWTALKNLLPAYRSITRVQLGNGATTAFWEDVWAADQPLATKFAALYSHVQRHGATVRAVIDGGLQHFLFPRFSTQAAAELAEVQALIDSTALTTDEDLRNCCFQDDQNKLLTSHIYQSSVYSGEECGWFRFVWRSYAPPRVKFFGWLLVQGRIQTKDVLLHKHILDDATCDICGLQTETATHLISGCQFAASFWEHLGWPTHMVPQAHSIWETETPLQVPHQLQSTFLLLCCWQLWKHRHDVVFRKEAPNLPKLLQTCKQECNMWKCRIPSSYSSVLDSWCMLFQMA